MGRPILERLRTDIIIECRKCKAHLTTPSTLISRLFQGTTGRAHLHTSAINLSLGPESTRTMTTGVHIIRDSHCLGCGSALGWIYVRAFEIDQKYKEGKVILEQSAVREIDLKYGRELDGGSSNDDNSANAGYKLPVSCESLSLGIL